jgi:phenylpropionate dioxygenase-like ring-hydroxylating dioxygenase large terminal subunit
MSTQPTGADAPQLIERPFRGQVYGEEHDGTYLMNWNPIMLAADLPAGEVVGKEFLGTRVIVYRGPDGAPVVQSAYCPHMGADLACGELVDGQVRCPYHFWKFAADGRCVEIPEEDTIPGVVKIYNYPTAERWGFIWAFNGEVPTYGMPEFPNVTEDELIYRAYHRGPRPVEGWIGSSNIVDFQHLKTVHGIPDPYPVKAEYTEHTLDVRQESPNRVIDTRLCLHLRLGGGIERLFMAGSSQIAPGWSDSFFLIALRKSEVVGMDDEAVDAEFQKRLDYVYKLYSEDEPILRSIRFRGYRKSALIRADRYMGEFLRYHDHYPRHRPFDT